MNSLDQIQPRYIRLFKLLTPSLKSGPSPATGVLTSFRCKNLRYRSIDDAADLTSEYLEQQELAALRTPVLYCRRKQTLTRFHARVLETLWFGCSTENIKARVLEL